MTPALSFAVQRLIHCPLDKISGKPVFNTINKNICRAEASPGFCFADSRRCFCWKSRFLIIFVQSSSDFMPKFPNSRFLATLNEIIFISSTLYWYIKLRVHFKTILTKKFYLFYTSDFCFQNTSWAIKFCIRAGSSPRAIRCIALLGFTYSFNF